MGGNIYWMYGFWVVIAGAKSVQAIRRLIAWHQLHVPAPTDRILLTAFWTVACLFYSYVCLRRWVTKGARRAA